MFTPPARRFHWLHSSNPGSSESFHNGCFHLTVLNNLWRFRSAGGEKTREESWASGHIFRKNKQCLTSVAQTLFPSDLHNKGTQSDWHLHLSDEASAPKRRKNKQWERLAASYTSIVIFALKVSYTKHRNAVLLDQFSISFCFSRWSV